MARHALLVGVSDFADPRLGRLNAPTADVHALAAALRDESHGVFDSVTIELRGDYLEVRNSIAQFFVESSPSDLLFFYYSGHGILSRLNRLFLACTNSNLDIPQVASISANEMRDWMSERYLLIPAE